MRVIFLQALDITKFYHHATTIFHSPHDMFIVRITAIIPGFRMLLAVWLKQLFLSEPRFLCASGPEATDERFGSGGLRFLGCTKRFAVELPSQSYPMGRSRAG